MLLDQEKQKLAEISKDLESNQRTINQANRVSANRGHYEALRRILHLYEDVVRRYRKQHETPNGAEFARLKELAGHAIEQLGGQAEPCPVSLKDYDHHRYGPFLGVSDEGSAVEHIREAALGSPKMKVLGDGEPIIVGVSHDAERLAAVGEVSVGPEEYRKIRLGAIGRILTSTNIGTRLNLRYYRKRPLIETNPGKTEVIVRRITQQAEHIFSPFLHTPDNVPRPLTVFVCFKIFQSYKKRLEILKAILEEFNKGSFCNPKVHKLGIFINVQSGKQGVKTTKEAIDLASESGLAEVAIEGVVRKQAADKISMPDLLNFFNAEQTTELMTYAIKQRVKLSPRNLVDADTVARNVWRGLQSARNMGLELGKYGLFPLTLPQCDVIMETVQKWFSSWTAAPAFYIDFPAVDSSIVYTEATITDGLRKWLQMVAKHAIHVVLIDTADKDKGRRILKNNPTDKVGILTYDQIAAINGYATKLGIKVLWAGGLTIPQAYQMGKLGVFGIYVTTAASAAVAVTGIYANDRMLASQKEPTLKGVSRVKLLLEAGFMVNQFTKSKQPKKAQIIEIKTAALIKAITSRKIDEERIQSVQDDLYNQVVNAWRTILAK
jgi:hypothetical protein